MPSLTSNGGGTDSPSLSPTTSNVESTPNGSSRVPPVPPIIVLSGASGKNTPVDELKAESLPHHLVQTHSDSELITLKQSSKRPTKLNRARTDSDDEVNSDDDNDDDDDDLLDYLKHRQSDDYKYIKFPILEQEEPPSKFFHNSVSFDDINLRCDTDDEPEWNDDLGWDLFRLHNAKGKNVKGYSNNYYYSSTRGRDSLRSPSPGGGTSPLASPTRRNSSPENLVGSSSISGVFDAVDGVPGGFIEYPSQPITQRKCCSISRQHVLYEALYKGKLPFLPKLPNRSILVYVSGRRHTWVALDWILTKFIENGDKVIIVSSVNADILERRRKRGRKGSTFTSPPKFGSTTAPLMRVRQRTVPHNIRNIASDIMDYVLTIIDPKVIAKVVVEIVAGKTKEVLKDLYRLYEPNLVCTGTKPNIKTGAPLKSWTSSKLTDRLVKNFPLPVIVVPAVNMSQFELELQSRFVDAIPEEPHHALSPKLEESVGDDSSINSCGSSGDPSSQNDQTDQSSAGSYSSYDEISNLYINYKRDVESELDQARELPVSANYYANLAKIISDKSSSLCSDIVDVSPDFRGNGSKLARAITGSNSFGVVPFRTKSLLGPVEDTTPKLSFKEVKEQLKKNKLQDDAQYLKPRATSLKFADDVKPNVINKKNLGKIRSHEVTSARPKLEPRKSHPGELKLSQSEDMLVTEKTKKSKKKGFWKSLFT
ncbi:uncharacterized protein SPAPADRAFT_152768 [Spathaspora passalidarum NRRL Y-27907]|uniref:UspA domain-containing protein n=1 Tax=Spathaspora passalidarum (strain NRRL Y-27907 / 11-Y1) TaxID=619300 RepID=G3APL6_SPAPN|nr:uncharacterized protein SPAPADRAFT_152768 [Spathaspora passalidarum NRRL Y-27907]EGW32187.1 hypothetical protein SPAPADRAFT_152768 [Spathaspora passalidarum NRRL Y-27907]